MNANLSFEIQAEAFRIMTGYMAPGKSVSPMANDGTSHQERWDAWRKWSIEYADVLTAMLRAMDSAMDSVIPNNDD